MDNKLWLVIISVGLSAAAGFENGRTELQSGYLTNQQDKANRTARIVAVGPDKLYSTPSAAALVVRDGDIVEIDSAVYSGDAAVWTQNNITIRGIGRPHIMADGAHAEGKGIWVIKGNDVTVENIEFSGARVPDGNGAAIRFEGSSMQVRQCIFHDNQNGFLCGENLNSHILFESCEFAYNGAGDGYTHNIYIGHVASFTLKFCYSHHAKIGHNVKSRAEINYILYNRIMDEKDGTSSFAIDLPNGGKSFIIGNSIQQGPETDNSNVISYGAEGLYNQVNQLYIVNNSFVNDRHYGVFIRLTEGVPVARVINNIFYGNADIINGQATILSNIIITKKRMLLLKNPDPGFYDMANYDYRLTVRSPAINKGIEPGAVDGFDLKPIAQYIHPLKGQKRVTIKSIDIGAYEYMNLDGP